MGALGCLRNRDFQSETLPKLLPVLSRFQAPGTGGAAGNGKSFGDYAGLDGNGLKSANRKKFHGLLVES
jgi:hypothetical protein